MTSPSKRICPTPTWNGVRLARCFARGSIRQPTPASAPRTVPQPVSSRSQIDLRPRPGPVPVGLPMPPAAVCHLSAAGTPTASWSSALYGSQCLLRLSATSAPRALQPRPGTGTMPTSTPEASWRGEGDIYRPFGTGTLNRTTSGVEARGKTVWNRCQTGLLPMLRPDFGTASPARGLSVASRRGEVVIYRLFIHKMPLFHGH